MTREPYFSTPYVIKQYQDVRIGIIGLTADGLMKNEYAEMEPDVKSRKPYYLLNAGFVIFMKLRKLIFNCNLSWWFR